LAWRGGKYKSNIYRAKVRNSADTAVEPGALEPQGEVQACAEGEEREHGTIKEREGIVKGGQTRKRKDGTHRLQLKHFKKKRNNVKRHGNILQAKKQKKGDDFGEKAWEGNPPGKRRRGNPGEKGRGTSNK